MISIEYERAAPAKTARVSDFSSALLCSRKNRDNANPKGTKRSVFKKVCRNPPNASGRLSRKADLPGECFKVKSNQYGKSVKNKMPKSEAVRHRFDHLRPAKVSGGWTIPGGIGSANLAEFDKQSENARNDEVKTGIFQFAQQFSTVASELCPGLECAGGKFENEYRNRNEAEVNRD
jgi:hypothetical protein